MSAEPAALRKAKALESHLLGTGTVGARITLTDGEAWELLNWLPDQLHPDSLDEFELDLSLAKLANNPWQMIDDTFVVFGFRIVRQADLH